MGDAILAIPCANSSTFELCRPPIMRSATTADISDSIAPSIATVKVGDSSVSIRSGRNCGTLSAGSPEGSPPKRLPIVSTGSPASATTDAGSHPWERTMPILSAATELPSYRAT